VGILLCAAYHQLAVQRISLSLHCTAVQLLFFAKRGDCHAVVGQRLLFVVHHALCGMIGRAMLCC
jgi:hypothetical protein